MGEKKPPPSLEDPSVAADNKSPIYLGTRMDFNEKNVLTRVLRGLLSGGRAAELGHHQRKKEEEVGCIEEGHFRDNITSLELCPLIIFIVAFLLDFIRLRLGLSRRRQGNYNLSRSCAPLHFYFL